MKKLFNNNLIKAVFLGFVAALLFIPAWIAASLFLDLIYYFYSAVGLSFYGIDVFSPDGWLKHIGIGIFSVTPLYFLYSKFNVSRPLIFVSPAVLLMIVVVAGNVLGNDVKNAISTLIGLLLIVIWAYDWVKENGKY